VRPSPGAAMYEVGMACDESDSLGNSDIAAPGDGRTPLAVSRCVQGGVIFFHLFALSPGGKFSTKGECAKNLNKRAKSMLSFHTSKAGKGLSAGLGIALSLFICTLKAWPQGCEPIRHMSLSLTAEGISYLQTGQWDASVSYRFLHAERMFIGDQEHPELQNPNGPRIDIHSVDMIATYAFTRRSSVTLTLPFVYAHISSVAGHADGMRHETSAGGLADLRLVGNFWLLDPAKHQSGNISLGAGVKAPTGDERAVDSYYRPTGVELVPVDQSIQPGDGGWGLVLEMQAFQRIFTNTFVYASGSYLINPREQNGTRPRVAGLGPDERFNSVPDQYTARLGVSQAIWPAKGLALSLGGRIDGLPVHDAIGGDKGLRRPGYTVYLEPGLNWTHGNYNFALSGPIALYRNRLSSVPEQERGTQGAGSIADFLITASLTRRF
jgi:hypothetical protein